MLIWRFLLLFFLSTSLSLGQISVDSWEGIELSEANKFPFGAPQLIFKSETSLYYLIFRPSAMSYTARIELTETKFEDIDNTTSHKIDLKINGENSRIEDIAMFRNKLFFLTSVFDRDRKKVSLFLRRYNGNGELSAPELVFEKIKLKDSGFMGLAGEGSAKEKTLRAGMAYFASRLVVSDDGSHMAVVSADADFDNHEGVNNWTVRLINKSLKMTRSEDFFSTEDDIYLEDLTLKDSTVLFAVALQGIHKSNNSYPIQEDVNYDPHTNFLASKYELVALNLNTGESSKEILDISDISQYDLSVFGEQVFFTYLKRMDKSPFMVDVGIKRYEYSQLQEFSLDEESEMIELSVTGEVEQNKKYCIRCSDIKTFFGEDNEPQIAIEFRKWTLGDTYTLHCGDIAIVQYDQNLDKKWTYHLERVHSYRSYFESRSMFYKGKNELVIFTFNDVSTANTYLKEPLSTSGYCSTMTVLQVDGRAEHKVIYSKDIAPASAGAAPGFSLIHGGRLYFLVRKMSSPKNSIMIARSNILFND